MSEVRQCRHVKDNGERCKMVGNISDQSGLCIWHDPDRKNEAAAVREKGRKNAEKVVRKKWRRTVGVEECPPAPKTVEDVASWLSWTAVAVASGTIDTKTSHEIGYTLRALLTALEKSEQSEKIEELRKKVAKLTEGAA